jgi:uncharacterized protein YbbC (DUF1343 family)
MITMRSSLRVGALIVLSASLLFCDSAARPRPPHVPRVPNALEKAPRPFVVAGMQRGDEEGFGAIDDAVKEAIDEAKMPGCVVVVGRRDDILLRRAYGSRAVLPSKVPMTLDTVFDLASLTKPIATATSIMILAERGKIDLDAPASRYVPELGKLPAFTVRNLLIHTSGLPAATPVSDFTGERTSVMQHIGNLTLKSQPGERFIYTDVGFVVLEEIVRRASGKDLASFASEEIFAPLGMKETGFLPASDLKVRAAPTEPVSGVFLQGEVHDPRARVLGGVAGHAGLFSTADDLARYARAMLNRGAFDGKRILGEGTFARIVTRHETPKGGRALGWDFDSSFATHRSPALSARAFGHGGFTGTAMWIDPDRDLFVVFLSNRVHPDGKGSVNPLISKVVTLVTEAVETKTGIDVLRAEAFERLQGAKIALVTNKSARAKDGVTTIDVLRNAPGVTLSAIFSPEHGLGAEHEGKIADGTYAGIPVFSLYGDRYAPTPETLDGIDTIVFDLQDVGVRFYTYASTMKRAMKIAAERKLRFVVLDRPNPLGGLHVAGPMLMGKTEGFVNHHPLPVRHGMTMGELARLFAVDDKIDVRLDVVRAQSWRRKDTFDRTGLVWAAPSPNLRNVDEVLLYPAIGLLEGTNISVGRGTDTPFEIVGAPWMDGPALAKRLEAAALPGVSFEATELTPRSSKHAGKKCGGVKIKLTDRQRFDAMKTSLVLAVALHELHPTDFKLDDLDGMLGSRVALDAIRDGKSPSEIEATWASDLLAFENKRASFLLYK